MKTTLPHIRRLMKKNKFDAVLLSSNDNITYLTNFSRFSKEERDAYILITPKKQYIFTHGIYTEAVKKYIKDFELITVSRQNPFRLALKKICASEKLTILGFEGYNLTALEYLTVRKELKKIAAQDAPFLSTKLRLIKTHEEIGKIKKACQLGDTAFHFILKKLKTGITELELTFELEAYIKKQGADISFDTIVAFGENAAFPHHQPTKKKLRRNNFVLFDFGVKQDNYCSDMTRTVFFGTPTLKQRKMYKTVLNSQQAAIDFLNHELRIKNPEIKLSEVDKTARNYIVQQGYPSIPHSLGHGIGIAVHEAPSLSPLSTDILQIGMVFSIEPGIYLPDIGGVRIEDLFAIQRNKLIPLTNSSRNLIEA